MDVPSDICYILPEFFLYYSLNNFFSSLYAIAQSNLNCRQSYFDLV